MSPAHGRGIGVRRRRLEHAELAEGDARSGDGGKRERQRRLRAAIAPPDRQVDCGQRQAGRGDHRPDDGDETHPARVTCHVHAGRVYLSACKEMRYVKASRAGRASRERDLKWPAAVPPAGCYFFAGSTVTASACVYSASIWSPTLISFSCAGSAT